MLSILELYVLNGIIHRNKSLTFPYHYVWDIIGFMTLYRRQWSRPSVEKEMQRGKMVVWGHLTNSCEKKGSKKQRRKGKIYQFECRVPIFVDKVISLLFNMLSRLIITFFPRSKCLLFHGCNHHLQWFWSPPPPKWSLSLFPPFHHLFAMKWWDQMA